MGVELAAVLSAPGKGPGINAVCIDAVPTCDSRIKPVITLSMHLPPEYGVLYDRTNHNRAARLGAMLHVVFADTEICEQGGLGAFPGKKSI